MTLAALSFLVGALMGWAAHRAETERERRRDRALGKVFEK